MTETMATQRIETKEDLDRLLQTNPMETFELEFKSTMDALTQLPRDTRSQEAKAEELAKDITAMANSAGGKIIYGVQETKAGRYDAAGMPRKNFPNADEPWNRFSDRFQLRISSITENRTDPPVRYDINLFSKGGEDDSHFYVVLNIPPIDRGLYMVRGEGRNGFYTRDNNRCRQFTNTEISDLMQRTQRGRDITDRIDRDFTIETTGRVADLIRLPDDEPLFREARPRIVLGLVPSNEYLPADNSVLSASDLDVNNWEVRVERLGNWNQPTKTTLDGLLFPLVDEADIPSIGAMSEHRFQQQPSGYIGAHKNGSFFFARRPHSNDETDSARMFRERCGGHGIHGLYELEIIEALQQVRKLAHTSTRRPQYWTLHADMLNVQGYKLVLVNEDQRGDVLSGVVYSEPQTRADLSFGPLRIRTLDVFENRGKAANQMRGFFNEVANAFGLRRSYQFGATGTWSFRDHRLT